MNCTAGVERELRARFRLDTRIAGRPSPRHHSFGPTFRGSIPNCIEGAFSEEEVVNPDRYMLLAQRLQLCIVVGGGCRSGRPLARGDEQPQTEVLLNRPLDEMDRLRDDADGLLILIINGPKETGGAPALRAGVRTKRSRSRIWACPGISARHPRQPGPRLPGEAVEAPSPDPKTAARRSTRKGSSVSRSPPRPRSQTIGSRRRQPWSSSAKQA